MHIDIGWLIAAYLTGAATISMIFVGFLLAGSRQNNSRRGKDLGALTYCEIYDELREREERARAKTR